MKVSSLVLLAAAVTSVHAFVPMTHNTVPSTSSSFSSTTSLNAIGVLAKKAKQASLKEYVSNGVEDHVMAVYKDMKAAVSSSTDDDDTDETVGPIQQAITKRKGTITIIAEYKRTNSEAENGFISEMFDPELLSPTFREFGASAVAVMADERMGGCSYDDINAFVVEQARAHQEVPGPIPVINNDLVIDELQIARSKAYGCGGLVMQYGLVKDELTDLLKATKAVGLEAIVAVSTHEEAQAAIDGGARMVSVVHVEGIEDKVAVIQDLKIPEGAQVAMIANIKAKNNKQLQEIEEAWALRDKGFNCVWVGEALYKSGADFTEHPGAIIKSMKSKSSLKWASPKASSGRGEGAREYLGDILM